MSAEDSLCTGCIPDARHDFGKMFYHAVVYIKIGVSSTQNAWAGTHVKYSYRERSRNRESTKGDETLSRIDV